ncbi:MAG: hypothetical protein ACK4F9_02100 [Brevinematia bacterium]
MISKVIISNSEVLTFLVYKNGLEFLQGGIISTNNSFSLLFNRKNQLLFFYSLDDNVAKVMIGDMWVNFGRGVILGDNKYHYFLKYLHILKYYTNSIFEFNYQYQDRNFDNVMDIRKGIGMKLTTLLTSYVFFLPEGIVSSNSLFGLIVEKDGMGILLGKYRNIFLSFNYKSKNLFNLGIVSDLEISAIVTSNILLGMDCFLEWYYNKFEFSSELRILQESFFSEFSSSLFSKSYARKLVIVSAKLDDRKTKLSYINKVNIKEELENEFYFSLIRSVSENVFIDLELLRDFDQRIIFLYFYPFMRVNTTSFFVKPLLNINNFVIERLEGGFSFEAQSFKIKLIISLPTSENNIYTFVSSEVRDNFGENIDVKVSNGNGITGIISIVCNTKDIKVEMITSISQKENFNTFLIFSSRI